MIGFLAKCGFPEAYLVEELEARDFQSHSVACARVLGKLINS